MTKQLRVTAADIFNGPLFKTGIGFDRLLDDLLDSSTAFASAGGYPPYNLARVTTPEHSDGYEITIAVAGFKQEDIEISVKENNLTVEGKQRPGEYDDSLEVDYLHKGIAERSFVRNFRLADHVEVQTASLQDGLLKITLVRNVPESAKPKRIEIQ